MRYAPSMPDIAPLAPITGICDVGSVRYWVASAIIPDERYIAMYLIFPNLSSMLSPKSQRYHMFPKMWPKPPCRNIDVRAVVSAGLAAVKP